MTADPPSDLRAEVVALNDRVSDWCDNLYEDAAARSALDAVLDLIDKHAREGQ